MITYTCADCGNPLTEVHFRDGNIWSVERLAFYGRRKHGRILDIECYRTQTQCNRERGIIVR